MGEVYTGNNITIENFGYNKANINIKGKAEQEIIQEVKGKTLTGESIYANDVEKEKGKIEIKGNAEQETREGYNSLDLSGFTPIDKNGIVATRNEDGSIKLNGTSTAGFGIYIPINKTLSSGSYKHSIGTVIPEGVYISLDNTSNTVISNSTGSKKIFEIIEETSYTNYLIWINADVTLSNLTIYPMLYQGTEDKPYEPYGASPSPDYPSPVKTVGQNVNVLPNTLQSKTLNGLIITVNEDKSVTIKGTATSNTSIDYCGEITLQKGEYAFDFKNPSPFNLFYTVDGNNVVISSSMKTVPYGTFVLENDTTISKFSSYVVSGTTIDTTLYPKIVKGTEVGGYSPHSQGSVEIEVCNKNILSYYDGNWNVAGVDVTVDKKGLITLNGTCTAATNIFFILKKTLKLNGIYSFQAGNDKVLTTGEYFRLYTGTTGFDVLKAFTTVTSINQKSENVQISGTADRLALRINQGTVFNNVTLKPQLEVGSKTSAYIEHESYTKVLPIQKEFVKIGDVEDTFIKRGDKWYEEHYMKKRVLNGSETITAPTSQNFDEYLTKFFQISVSDVKYESKAISDYFKYIYLWNNDTTGIWIGSSPHINIRILKEIASTKEDFKTWLSNNNVTVYYVLAEPELIPCTEEQEEILRELNNCTMYLPVTNIHTESSLEPNVSLQYNYIPASPSPEYPSEIMTVGQNGSVEIEVCNKNFIKMSDSQQIKNNGITATKIEKGWSIQGISTAFVALNLGEVIAKAGTYTFSTNFSKSSLGVYVRLRDKTTNAILAEIGNNQITSRTYTINTDINANFVINIPSGTTVDIQITETQFEKSPTKTNYTPHESQTVSLPIQKEFVKIGDVEDTFIKRDGKWYEAHYQPKIVFDGTENFILNTGLTNDNYLVVYKYITGMKSAPKNNLLSNYFIAENARGSKNCIYGGYEEEFDISISKTIASTVDELKSKLAEWNNNGTPMELYYPLATPELIECTPAQENLLNQLANIQLYEGINHIIGKSSIDPELEVIVTKVIEDYDFYISSTGKLVIPEFNIEYLIDFYESNIPTMPEATESSVRAAGRDGDIPLKTTYEPIPLNIVCYTEDNLSLAEKVSEETKINKFLNTIKNKTKSLAIEKYNKFYNVKYNGALTTMNFPKHLKFGVPLKSSESYGKDLIQKSIIGNSKGESNTIEEAGAIFTIKGPALNPIISFNDYSMEYNMNILEGARIEIDSNKSTITHINSDGIKTNVMKHYNHQFPKVQYGVNELKVLSGIEDDLNVSVTWNDLKL